jgi:anti-sigma factor RsiW
MKDEKLQRYFDGELSADERTAFEAAMTDDDRERLAALAEMRGLVTNALTGAAGDVDLLPGIEAHLAGVSSLDAARRKKAGWFRSGRFLGTSAGVLAVAAAAFLFMVQPWHPTHPSDNCDVETLEVEGAMASVFKVHDAPHAGDTATVIWTAEED